MAHLMDQASPQCHTAIAGRFEQNAGDFGQRRIPLWLNPQP